MNDKSLPRKLGLWSAVSLIVGTIIGSSIFMKPDLMSAQVGSPLLLLGVWLGAGFISLVGAMIFAEIGSRIPATGGEYVYLREIFGGFPAYLYGWAGFIVSNTGAIAAIIFIFVEYLGYFIPIPRLSPEMEKSLRLHIPGLGDFFILQNLGVKVVCAGILVILTAINSRSVKGASWFQVFTTLVKVSVFLLLVGVILGSGKGDVRNWVEPAGSLEGFNLLLGISAAMAGAFAAYDGWINLNFVGGEVKNPDRNIPRSLIIGVLICIVVYLLVNLAFLYVLPAPVMANSSLLATDAFEAATGRGGAAPIALLVVISTLSSANGNIMSSARVVYAMAHERIFVPWAGRVHGRYNTPSNALWIQAAWAMVLIFTGSFDMLTEMFVFIAWLFYGMTALGWMWKRSRYPASPGGFRIPGFPWLPALFILFSIFYTILTLYHDIQSYLDGSKQVVHSLYALLLTALGIPFYLYRRSRRLQMQDATPGQ